MKKCPSCEKEYDDSWDVCLNCENTPLVSCQDKEKYEQKRQEVLEKKEQGIRECDKCTKEFHQSDLKKISTKFLILYVEMTACPECYKQIKARHKIWGIIMILMWALIVIGYFIFSKFK